MDLQYQGVQGMDKDKASIIARKYIEFIRKRDPNVKKAFIFGSHVKGTCGEDSDIDLALVFKKLNNTFDMQVQLMKLRRKFDTRIEPHAFRESDFNISNPFANEILKTGLEIT